MRESKVEKKQKLISVGTGLAVVAIGALVAVRPFNMVNILLIVACVAVGLYEFNRWHISADRAIWALLAGIVSVVFALLGICNLAGVLFAWDIVLYTIPSWGICYGAIKALGAFQMYRAGETNWGWGMLTGVLSVLIGALLILLPLLGIMTMTEFTGMLIGVLLLVVGINISVDAYA
ncbi:MAG: hypothetical protein IJP03_06320 [Christensenellaceae bacterium]|nr:hypothetical protein [Christensenellaceae bacterium]